MKNDSILRGYTTPERPYKVDNYPWGFKLKTTIHYWIESKPGLGDRMGTYTINPKNGRPCAPKYTTYSPFMYLYLDEIGHVKNGIIESFEVEEFKLRFAFIIEKIGEEFINDIQKQNIRVNHYQHIRGNAPYILNRFKEENKGKYIEWVKNTLAHIKGCEFKELVNYPEPPTVDFTDI